MCLTLRQCRNLLQSSNRQRRRLHLSIQLLRFLQRVEPLLFLGWFLSPLPRLHLPFLGKLL